MIPTMSYGGKQPSILAQAYANRPADWGDKKCPCCGGNTNNDKRVCSTCKRDAEYNEDWAARVRAIEARLAEEAKKDK